MSLQANLVTEFSQPGVFDILGQAFIDIGRLNELDSLNATLAMPPADLVQSRLIQVDQEVNVRFRWRTKGNMAHAFNPTFRWEIELFFERYGVLEFALPNSVKTLVYGDGDQIAPDEVQYPGTGIGFNPAGVGGANATTITIPPNTVPAGIYDVVAVIRMLHEAGNNTPCFLAAFAEFGKINFYQEH